MEGNFFDNYTYEYKNIPLNNLITNNLLNNNNYGENIIYNKYNNYNREYKNYNDEMENKLLRNEYEDNNSNNKSFTLMNEINELKKKYLMAKEKLELAKNQKEKDDKYIEDLENQIALRYQNKNQNKIENMKFKENSLNFNNIYKKEKIKNSINNKSNINNNSKYNNTNEYKKIKKIKSNISDFTVFDNNSSFKKTNKIINTKNNKNLSETNIKDNIPLKNNTKKNIKRNNSSILNNTWFNNKNNINKKSIKFFDNLKNNNKNDYFSFNKNTIMNDDYIIDKNKIIIRNCNCIIDLNPDNNQNYNLFKNAFSNINNMIKKNEKLKIMKNKKNEEKKIVQERYLIIDEKKKPIYIKGKQVLGMNLMPLRGENNEIISDNDKNIFLYDLDGRLHNQKDLENIILDNGLFLVNENNIPILGINNIPIIDQYGDFIFRRKPFIYDNNNYKIGVYADILRDKEGKPIKILIEKYLSNEQENIQNKSFNNNNLNILNKNKNIHKEENKMEKNNPVIEIELKPYSKLITSKDQNYYYYLKNHQINNSPFNDKNKFNFEKSLRSYIPKIKMKKKKKK